MKIYIAGPFFNEEQLSRIITIESMLDAHGIKYFSPRKFRISDRPDLESSILKDMDPGKQREVAKAIFDSNIDGIRGSDGIIAVIDDKDTGTSFELGYAACFARRNIGSRLPGIYPYRIITINFTGKGLNVMLRECVDFHAQNESQLDFCLRRLTSGNSLPRLQDDGEIE